MKRRVVSICKRGVGVISDEEKKEMNMEGMILHVLEDEYTWISSAEVWRRLTESGIPLGQDKIFCLALETLIRVKKTVSREVFYGEEMVKLASSEGDRLLLAA